MQQYEYSGLIVGGIVVILLVRLVINANLAAQPEFTG
jgi:hypothetical protein